jgi:hypothetical protein
MVNQALDEVHPRMLAAGKPVDHEKLVEDSAREIGQAFDYAIDRARTNKGALASDMKYPDQGAISRWVSGREQVQLSKLRAGNRVAYVLFLLTLLEMEPDVEVRTLVSMKRIG